MSKVATHHFTYLKKSQDYRVGCIREQGQKKETVGSPSEERNFFFPRERDEETCRAPERGYQRRRLNDRAGRIGIG